MLKIEAKDSCNSVDNLEYVEPEIWKDIEGYDGWYQVSNKGRVRSWRYGSPKKGRRSKPHIMKTDSPERYNRARLTNNGDRKMESVHRLVAKAFIPNPDNKPQVNHKNGNRRDNREENLEWVTAKENAEHASCNGLLPDCRGSKHSQSKFTEDEVLEIRAAYKLGCFTQKEIAKAYDVSKHVVHYIVNRKSWKHI